MIMHRIPLYGVIIFLAVFIGLQYIYINLKTDILENKMIKYYFIMYIPFVFIFGKLYTIYAYSSGNIITAGLSSYGGLIGTILAAYIFEKIIFLNGKLIKYTILSLPLIYSLSKLACFISGCCSGIEYSGLFYVIYPFGKNIPQFPIQLLETIVFLILFLICNHYKNKKYISYFTIMLVSIFKFLLDYLRIDHGSFIFSPNQIFSIVLLLLFVVLFLFKYFKSKKKIVSN